MRFTQIALAGSTTAVLALMSPAPRVASSTPSTASSGAPAGALADPAPAANVKSGGPGPAVAVSPTVAAVLQMLHSGVETPVLAAYIANATNVTDLSAAEIVRLHQEGLAQELIADLIRRAGELREQPKAAQTAETAPAATPPPRLVGAVPAIAATPPPPATPYPTPAYNYPGAFYGYGGYPGYYSGYYPGAYSGYYPSSYPYSYYNYWSYPFWPVIFGVSNPTPTGQQGQDHGHNHPAPGNTGTASQSPFGAPIYRGGAVGAAPPPVSFLPPRRNIPYLPRTDPGLPHISPVMPRITPLAPRVNAGQWYGNPASGFGNPAVGRTMPLGSRL